MGITYILRDLKFEVVPMLKRKRVGYHMISFGYPNIGVCVPLERMEQKQSEGCRVPSGICNWQKPLASSSQSSGTGANRDAVRNLADVAARRQDCCC